MAKTLGFTVSSSKFRSSANLSHIIYSSSLSNSSAQVSTCPIINGFRLSVNWAGKPGINVAGQSVSCSVKVMCRSSLNPRNFSPEAIDSCTNVEEISWGLGDRVGRENAKQVFRNDNAPVASNDSSASTHVERAWNHWNLLGAPKLIVALPMMDQSELPFRRLCRKYDATAAYTQMFHSRPFALQPGYRRVEFSTCPEDRPLFVQFGANDPEILLKAALTVQEHCDYVDINLGCPQCVAKRGNYGAFFMDDLRLIESMVTHLATNLTTLVSCKVRILPDI